MATPVVMEALSPTMEEGRVVKWHKREGDPVRAGDVLAEVETDKAVMDLVARADGILRRVAVAEGQTVPVGAALAVIAAPGEEPAAGAPAPAASRPAAAVPAPAAAAAPPGGAAAIPRIPADATRVKASPLARRLARERGVDLALVTGTGPGGRVTKRDLETAARGAAAAVRAVPVPPAPPGAPPPPRPPPAPAGPPAPAAPAAPPAPPASEYEDVPLSPLRKTIAKRLAASLGPIPHFFLTAEIDMERAAEAREALNRDLAEDDRISINDLVIKAAALALTRHRACNAWFQEDHIRYWHAVHIGMAVAVEDGLITPVLRHADRKPLAALAREARALAERARQRRLQPEEYTGATFSVSNLGMFAIDQFTAVINPPEAAILAVGAVTPKPVVVDGQVVPRRRLRVTLSCDHRVVDGATGAAFLKTLKQMLENPLAML
jgi:pyruvate dehydrogenase E2 component (dihydrolipoamide acetyltransferase)